VSRRRLLLALVGVGLLAAGLWSARRAEGNFQHFRRWDTLTRLPAGMLPEAQVVEDELLGVYWLAIAAGLLGPAGGLLLYRAWRPAVGSADQ
jgi:hypothetical protein